MGGDGKDTIVANASVVSSFDLGVALTDDGPQRYNRWGNGFQNRTIQPLKTSEE